LDQIVEEKNNFKIEDKTTKSHPVNHTDRAVQDI